MIYNYSYSLVSGFWILGSINRYYLTYIYNFLYFTLIISYLYIPISTSTYILFFHFQLFTTIQYLIRFSEEWEKIENGRYWTSVSVTHARSATMISEVIFRWKNQSLTNCLPDGQRPSMNFPWDAENAKITRQKAAKEKCSWININRNYYFLLAVRGVIEGCYQRKLWQLPWGFLWVLNRFRQMWRWVADVNGDAGF